MTRSQRMRPVREVADGRQRRAQQALAQAQDELAQQEARLRQLLEFRGEYDQRLSDESSAGLGAGRLQDFRSFLVTLGQAIDEQSARVETSRRELDRRRDEWLALKQRTEAIDKVVTRLQDEEQRDEQRRDQRSLDELALRGGDKGER